MDNSADYDAVVVERDRLKANLERVSAQWTSRVKKLEERIKKYEEGRDPSEVHVSACGCGHCICTGIERPFKSIYTVLVLKVVVIRVLYIVCRRGPSHGTRRDDRRPSSRAPRQRLSA